MIIGLLFSREKARIEADENYRELEQKLLTMGGQALVYMPSPQPLLRLIIESGRTFDTGQLKKVKDQPSHCHDNVAARWTKGKDKYQMAHGYGLSDDGLWRQHSWLIDTRKKTIIETTLPRMIYYGVILEGDASRQFAESN